jgi:hypothetical protein
MEGSSGLTWRKSSRSGTDNGGGNCVEVASLRDRVLVRDSADPAGPVLAVTPAQWRAFVARLG